MIQRNRQTKKLPINFNASFKEIAESIEKDGFQLVGKKIIPFETYSNHNFYEISQKRLYWHDFGVLICLDAYRPDPKVNNNPENDRLNAGRIYTNLVDGTKQRGKVYLNGSGTNYGRGDGTSVDCHEYDFREYYQNLMHALEKKQLKVCLPWIYNGYHQNKIKEHSMELPEKIQKIMGPPAQSGDWQNAGIEHRSNAYWTELIQQAYKKEGKKKPLRKDRGIYFMWSKFILTPHKINDSDFNLEKLSLQTSLGHNILHVIPFVSDLKVRIKLTETIFSIFSQKELIERLNQGDAHGITGFLNLVRFSACDPINNRRFPDGDITKGKVTEGYKSWKHTQNTMQMMMEKGGEKLKLANPYFTFLNAASMWRSEKFPEIIEHAIVNKLEIPWVWYKFNDEHSSQRIIKESFKGRDVVFDALDKEYGAFFNPSQKLRSYYLELKLHEEVNKVASISPSKRMKI